ncbi:hypothetical protein JHN50_24600 [Streptomyces sp. MBT98]|nr:hypothetical protein [Streptomyces sp. MBT98]MBK3617801.1 hypothetical protein [Streptomyces sp. MBT98]
MGLDTVLGVEVADARRGARGDRRTLDEVGDAEALGEVRHRRTETDLVLVGHLRSGLSGVRLDAEDAVSAREGRAERLRLPEVTGDDVDTGGSEGAGPVTGRVPHDRAHRPAVGPQRRRDRSALLTCGAQDDDGPAAVRAGHAALPPVRARIAAAGRAAPAGQRGKQVRGVLVTGGSKVREGGSHRSPLR